MSNFFKKGNKESLRKYIKKSQKAFNKFNKSLLNMNHVYSVLVQRDDITEENLEEEIKKLTSYKFSEFELDLLKKDLCQ